MVQLSPFPFAIKRRGFSLLELLAVVAIIAILLLLAVSSMRSHSGTELSVGVTTLGGVLDEARIAAISRNKYVQVRLMREGTSGPFTSLVLLEADSPYYRADQAGYISLIDAGQMRQIGPVRDLGRGLVIAADSRSPLVQGLEADTEFPRSGRMRISGRERDFLSFYYRPNGATDFETLGGVPTNPRQNFFALGTRATMELSGTELPENFALLTIFPTTGRYLVFRP